RPAALGDRAGPGRGHRAAPGGADHRRCPACGAGGGRAPRRAGRPAARGPGAAGLPGPARAAPGPAELGPRLGQAATLALGPLDDTHSRALLAWLAAPPGSAGGAADGDPDGGLPAVTRDRVIATAGGNPLF